MFKKTVFLIMLSLLLVAPPVMAEVGVTDSEVKIGSTSALGGHASFLGTQLTQGSLALIKETNANGGVNGRTINLVCLDDKYDPPKTLANTKTLINDEKVFMLFDYVGTPTSRVILKTVQDAKVPLLGLFTGAEFLRNPFRPYIFNVRSSYFLEVETIINKWVKEGKTNIAVFRQDDAFGVAVLGGVTKALKKRNLKLGMVQKFKRGMTPSMSDVKKIADTKPDAVIMVGTYTPLASFVNLSKKAGLKDTEFHTVSFVGSEAFAKELLKHGSKTGENVFVTQVVPSPTDTSNEMVKEFQELYKKHYPKETPNYVALEGFINAKILITALERSGATLTRRRIKKVIETMKDYNAGTGLPSVVSGNNHSFFKKVYISTIKGKSFEIIE
jgi:ABC-type branched-subunit amino acid transport system substrate-binding protein